MVVFPTPQPMKRQVPTGGVQRPMQRLAIRMMPKWMSDSPSWRTTGSRIGVKIRMAGVMSMNIPTTSSSALIVSRMTTGFCESPISAAETVCGMLATVMIQDIALEAPISSITTAVVMPVCRQMPGRSFQGISR